MVNGYASLHKSIIELIESVDDSLTAQKTIPGIHEWATSIANLNKPVVGSFRFNSAVNTISFITTSADSAKLVAFTGVFFLDNFITILIAVHSNNVVQISFEALA